MKYLKLFENFSEEKPKSITIELSDNFIEENKLYKFNHQIEMQPGLYYNLGNTKSEIGKPSNFFFATYLPDINEIQYFIFETNTAYQFLKLANEKSISEIQKKRLIDSGRETGLRFIPMSYSKFERGFEVGEVGDRGGYFKITAVEPFK